MGKDSEARKYWGQEEKGAVTEDEMLGWPHWLNGYEFGQTQGDNNGHRSLEHATVYGVTRSQTWLSDWTATNTWEQTLLCILDHKISPILHPLFKTSYWELDVNEEYVTHWTLITFHIPLFQSLLSYEKKQILRRNKEKWEDLKSEKVEKWERPNIQIDDS